MESSELVESLSEVEHYQAFCSSAVLYLGTVNSIVEVVRGRVSLNRSSDTIPKCLPLSFAKMSAVELVDLLRANKVRLEATFDEELIQQSEINTNYLYVLLRRKQRYGTPLKLIPIKHSMKLGPLLVVVSRSFVCLLQGSAV